MRNDRPCDGCGLGDNYQEYPIKETIMSSEILTSITQYAVANKADGKAFNTLRTTAHDIQMNGEHRDAHAAEFLDNCNAGEVEFMTKYHANDQNAKTKGTKEWKFRTYLPNAYSTSKGVLAKALQGGILVNDKGKTAIEKLTKAAAPLKQEKDPMEVFHIQLANVRRALAALTAQEQAVGRTELYTLATTLNAGSLTS